MLAAVFLLIGYGVGASLGRIVKGALHNPLMDGATAHMHFSAIVGCIRYSTQDHTTLC